jgi:hypothetical protein|tara:strand:- start:809 stop:982 length:174 start_codon:yes stop_codon:yes gene_type:complete
MLQQLKIFYDLINASEDGLGLPLKNIISKLKKVILATVILCVSVGIGVGYLIFVIIL